MSQRSDEVALLERHRPIARYDRFEPYFATRVDAVLRLGEGTGEVADSRCSLCQGAPPGGAVLARSGTQDQGPSEWLTGLHAAADGTLTYPNGTACAEADVVGMTVASGALDYRRDGAIQQQRYGHAVYGRVRRTARGFWLQYWFFSFGDDRFDPGLGGRPQDEHVWDRVQHECDWEMVQILVPPRSDDPDRPASRPTRVTYSQHTSGARRAWRLAKRQGDRLVVYVGRGTHANYARRTFWVFDRSDGDYAVEPDLEFLDDATPWTDWPGTWGASPGSPEGFPRHDAWTDPDGFDEQARGVVVGFLRGSLWGSIRGIARRLSARARRQAHRLRGVRARSAPPRPRTGWVAEAVAPGTDVVVPRRRPVWRPWVLARGTVSARWKDDHAGHAELLVRVQDPGLALSIRYLILRIESRGQMPRVYTWLVEPGSAGAGFVAAVDIPWTLATDRPHSIEVRGASLWGLDESPVDQTELGPAAG